MTTRAEVGGGVVPGRVGGPGAGMAVTVVVNNHDYGDYVGVAIESALAQTHRPLEVVVVDDGSTDGSRDLIRAFGDRIRPVFTPNGGQASALNAGFAASRGRLVLFLDADDALEPDAAASLAAAWRPGVSRVQAPVTLIDAAGHPRGGRLPSEPMPAGDLRPLVLHAGGYPSTGTTGVAFSRECLDRLMPIPETEWRRAPDVYLWLLAPFVGSVVSLDRPIARVRIHGANRWSMSRLTTDRLVEHLATDARKERLLHDRAADLGTAPPDDWLLRTPTHVKSRLALLRLDPARHPFPADRPLRLARHGVTAALRHPAFTVRKRLFLAVWFVLVAVLPRRAAARLVRAGMIRTERPRWLQRWLERRPARRGRSAVAP